MKITFSSSVEKMREINHSFDSGVLKVAYVGKNRNGSSISKEVFEKCMDSIYNCPIVCNYNRELDEIGSHDIEIVMKDGMPTIVNITQPVGVVPESANIWWEEFEDDSGVHEYLCAEVLIWKRQEAYEKIKDNVITDESMEISVKRGHMEDGYYVIDDFEFLAFCLLESAEPCYESASLAMFGMDNFKSQYAKMMEEFKESFKQVNTSVEVDIHPQNLMEGGEEHLEQKMELLTKFGLSADQVDFDIETMSLEELEAELNARFSNNEVKEDVEVKEETHEDTQFSLTGEQFREELIDALHAEKTVDPVWGEMCRYMYCDYDSDAMEVFCYDIEDWKLYGFTYALNGDNVVIDFESKKRKKLSIVDFDEGDMDQSYKTMFDAVVDASVSAKASEMNAEFEAAKTELEEKYNAASDTIQSLNIELDELRQYKQEQLEIKRAADVDAVFAMFEDLNGIEAFDALKDNCAEMSIEDIEDKCYAIRGRNTTQTFAAKQPKATRLPVEKGKRADDEPYGGFFLEFPPMR